MPDGIRELSERRNIQPDLSDPKVQRQQRQEVTERIERDVTDQQTEAQVSSGEQRIAAAESRSRSTGSSLIAVA